MGRKTKGNGKFCCSVSLHLLAEVPLCCSGFPALLGIFLSNKSVSTGCLHALAHHSHGPVQRFILFSQWTAPVELFAFSVSYLE